MNGDRKNEKLDLKYEFPARNIERSSVEKQAASDPLAFLEDDGFEGLPNDESDYVKVHKEFFANNNTCNEAKESLMDLYLDDTYYAQEYDDPFGLKSNSFDFWTHTYFQPCELPPETVFGLKGNLLCYEQSGTITAGEASSAQYDASTKDQAKMKMTTNVPQNCYPSDVKGMFATGVFDGVKIKYISRSADKTLEGIVEGTRYLCLCNDCKGQKALKASEFEKHAGCKSSYPNSRIHFENGKSVVDAVGELKNTPESELFEAVKNVAGSAISHEKLIKWKEHYDAAAAELSRIYRH